MQEDSLSAEPPGKPKDFLTLNQNWNMQTSFPSCLLHQHLCVSSCNKQYSEIISASERQCLWFYPSFIILEKKSQRNDYLILKARQKSISETVWLESSLLLDNISFSHSVMSDSWRPHGLYSTGFFVHGILQARILQWVAKTLSRGSSQPRDWTQVFCTAGRFFIRHSFIWQHKQCPFSTITHWCLRII